MFVVEVSDETSGVKLHCIFGEQATRRNKLCSNQRMTSATKQEISRIAKARVEGLNPALGKFSRFTFYQTMPSRGNVALVQQ
jgi:hypothetical protein